MVPDTSARGTVSVRRKSFLRAPTFKVDIKESKYGFEALPMLPVIPKLSDMDLFSPATKSRTPSTHSPIRTLFEQQQRGNASEANLTESSLPETPLSGTPLSANSFNGSLPDFIGHGSRTGSSSMPARVTRSRAPTGSSQNSMRPSASILALALSSTAESRDSVASSSVSDRSSCQDDQEDLFLQQKARHRDSSMSSLSMSGTILRRLQLSTSRPTSEADSQFLNSLNQLSPAETSPVSPPPASPDSKKVLVRFSLPQYQCITSVLLPPEVSMEAALRVVCQKKSLDFASHALQVTLPSGVVSADMDRTVGLYMFDWKATEWSVVKTEKLYSTMYVKGDDDEEVMILQQSNGRYQVMAGKVNNLISRLTDGEEPDDAYLDIFFLTYRSFLKPIELLDGLIARFNSEIAPNASPEDIEYFNRAIEPTQKRVAWAIQNWVNKFYQDFIEDSALEADILDFATQLKEFSQFKDIGAELIASLERQKKVAEEEEEASARVVTKSKQIDSSIFLTVNPQHIARQLCVHNLDLFRKIHQTEFLNQIWSHDANSANLKAFIERFDKESYWVATEICMTKDIKNRGRILKRFIRVAHECKERNNFFSVFSIIAGLNLSPVQRLKKTWDSLSSETKQMWTEVEKFADPSRNMKNYRDHLATCSAPIVPFLPIYFKDLTFINDGNAKMVKNLVNFDKCRMLAKRVYDLADLTATPFPYEKDPPILNYLARPHIEKSIVKLKELSLECEPATK
ncbi:hypothetical protein SmJEL517_g04435 [Synchytrium microbalum]|uniref:Ras-GEF domain-containing protein n=1 Tax=Synchytrium microbalum TaxID=1806994 RepID=A0A507BS18_9FUNG|nr:uncharacterized protein SmJEL517_g04435 [Synchytrium microbalum]TPX32440.1 hypothetical protein SmJEL517_g04435 [Synchytrium microbalum]